jgi:Uma2 family endonuclease
LPYDEWFRYELINGKLYIWEASHVDHQWMLIQIGSALLRWSDKSRLGKPCPQLWTILSDTDGVIPDLSWHTRQQLKTRLNENGHFVGPPTLVVEILDPDGADRVYTQQVKLLLYETSGVPEYWIVDGQAQQIAVYRREQHRLWLDMVLWPGDILTSPLLPGFACPVARLFEE